MAETLVTDDIVGVLAPLVERKDWEGVCREAKELARGITHALVARNMQFVAAARDPVRHVYESVRTLSDTTDGRNEAKGALSMLVVLLNSGKVDLGALTRE